MFRVHPGTRISRIPWALKSLLLVGFRSVKPPCRSLLQYWEKSEVSCSKVWTVGCAGENADFPLILVRHSDLGSVGTGVIMICFARLYFHFFFRNAISTFCESRSFCCCFFFFFFFSRFINWHWPSLHYTYRWGLSGTNGWALLAKGLHHFRKKCFVCIIHGSKGAGIACWLERWTRDRKVASSNPGRSGGRIFFSRVNFMCYLLFSVRSNPVLPQWHVQDPGHSSKKQRWQVIPKHAYTLDPTKSEWAHCHCREIVWVTYLETSLHATHQATLGHSPLSSLRHFGPILV